VVAAARGLSERQQVLGSVFWGTVKLILYDGEKKLFRATTWFLARHEGSGGYLGKRIVLRYLHKEMGADKII
jgi:hypothetical protein